MADTIHLKLNPLLGLTGPLGFLDANLYRDAEEYRKELLRLQVAHWASEQEAKFLRLECEAKDG